MNLQVVTPVHDEGKDTPMFPGSAAGVLLITSVPKMSDVGRTVGSELVQAAAVPDEVAPLASPVMEIVSPLFTTCVPANDPIMYTPAGYPPIGFGAGKSHGSDVVIISKRHGLVALPLQSVPVLAMTVVGL